MDLLEEIMDQECDTILEDESIKEISVLLLRFLEMLKNNQLEAIQSELLRLLPCDQWITPGRKINIISPASDCSSDEDAEEMDDKTNTHSLSVMNNSTSPSTSGSTMQVMEEDEVDPGWTVVQKGKRRNLK